MKRKNISDIIENYLKESLVKKNDIVIKRNEIANLFDCVPSQINYVINTRFTQKRGYVVESKRGGTGYIRITKMELVNKVHLIDQLILLIGKKITQKEAEEIVFILYEEKLISKREALLINNTLDIRILSEFSINVDEARAFILIEQLLLLRFENISEVSYK